MSVACALALGFAGAPLSSLVELYAAAATALALLYLIKQRRQKVVVSFGLLWQRALGERGLRRRWRVPRRLRSLLLQLVILGCIVLAAADPERDGAHARPGRHVVIAVDASASMQAEDESLPGAPGRRVTRLARARDDAERVIASLSSRDRALVLVLDGQPRPLSGFDDDGRALSRQVDGIVASDAPADFDRGLRAAADLLAGTERPTLVVVSDGAWPQSTLDAIRLDPARAPRPDGDEAGAIDLRGVDLRFVPVGHDGDNVGIVAFAARRPPAGGSELSALVEVRAFGSAPARVTLELRQDGAVVETVPLALLPGERAVRRFADLAGRGARIEARLVAAGAPDDAPGGPRVDAFPLDDRAFAVVPPARRQRVLVVSDGNLFLEGALLSDENVEVVRSPAAGYSPSRAAAFDAVIFDGYTPDAPPAVPALYLDPRGAASPFPIAGELRAPIVTNVAARHPLMHFVTLFDLNVSRASRFALAPGDVALASSVRDPIYVARALPHRTAALGFDVRRSDLPLRMAFPVMLENLLRWFAGDEDASFASYATGAPVRLAWPEVAGPAGVIVIGPGGDRAEVPVVDGALRLRADRVGYYEATGGGAMRAFAVNLADAAESAIAPRRALVIDGVVVAAPDAPSPRALPPWILLALAAFALLVAEYWTWHRRITE